MLQLVRAHGRGCSSTIFLPKSAAKSSLSCRVFFTSGHTSSSTSARKHLQIPTRPSLPHNLARMSAHQHRSHAGHSHHHHEDNVYLTSTNKNDAGVKVTRLGLYVNLGMAISKGIGGYYFNSQALVADAFHALTDLVSDFMTLATISVALKPPTLLYPNGYGKVESFGSLFVSGLLLTGGLLMAQHAGGALIQQFFPDIWHYLSEVVGLGHGGHGHSHSHSAADTIPNLNAAWLAGGSIIIKEYLYRITMKVARERKSSVLASNAIHHRVDSLTSIVALIAIGGAHLLNGAAWLDPVGGLIVSLMVIQAGFGNTVSAVYELCDKTVDEEVKKSVKRAAQKALTSEQVIIREVQGTKAGQNYLMDIELGVPSTWTLKQLGEVEDAVRTRIGSKVRGTRRIKIRFVPDEDKDAALQDEFIGADISPRSSPEPEPEEDHEHHNHSHDHGHSTGVSDSTSRSRQR